MQELKPIKEGKVREIYDNGDSLIMVATDRISCFDVILHNEITKKGTVLTQMSKFWFDMTEDILPNHMISVDVKDMPEFEKFVESGVSYHEKADHVENTMHEFKSKTEDLEASMTSISDSVEMIAKAIEDSVTGISSTATETQALVSDMHSINEQMDNNQNIAIELKQEAEVFTEV